MRRMWRLSLALIIAGPGPAFAQVSAPVQIRIAVPVAPVTGPIGAGSAAPGLSPFLPSLSVPSLSAPSLSAPPALAALTPALAAPAASFPVLPLAAVPGAALPSALAAQRLPAAADSRKPAGPALPGEARTPKTALEGLKTELETPAPDARDLAAGREHAARSFEAKLGVESDDSAAPAAFTEGSFQSSAKVQAPLAQAGDDGGESANAARAPPGPEAAGAPNQKVSRAVRIGGLTAVAMLAFDVAVFAGASLLGYEFRPSYQTPELANPAAFSMFGDTIAMFLAKAQMLFMGAGLAPYWEEVAFRAGVIGMAGIGATWLAKKFVWGAEKFTEKAKAMRPWILPAAFGIAAAEAALFFTVLHEVSDPVLISIRVAQALLLSYLYVREGLVSGMVHHGVFNGLALLTMPLFMAGASTILIGPAIGLSLGLAALAGAIWYFTRGTAIKENMQIREGTLSPYRLSVAASRLLGRLGWASVALLGGLAMLQPTQMGMLLVGGMALQVAPFAFALQVYATLLESLGKREGQEAVNEIRDPKNPLPLFNKVGRQVGSVILATLFGLLAGGWLPLAILNLFPMAGLWPAAGIGAAIPAAAALGMWTYRLLKKKAITPLLFGLQAFLFGTAFSAVGLPLAAMLLEQGTTDGLTAAAQGMSTTTSLGWMMPAFIGLAALMTYIGKRVADGLTRQPGPRPPEDSARTPPKAPVRAAL